VDGFLIQYRQTGDASLADRYWDAIMGDLAWFHELSDERTDKILNADWDKIRGIKSEYGGFHGDNTCTPDMIDKSGPHAAFSCFYLKAMRSALELVKILGRSSDAEDLEIRIGVLASSIYHTFWDTEKGCIADTLSRTTWSVQSNAMAVLAGAVPDDALPGLKQHMEHLLKSIFVNGYDPSDGAYFSPHFSFYIFDALYRLGLYNVAESTIRQGWGWMLSQGLVTCSEFFSLKDSLCHAWSASPVWYLSTNLLGVRYPEAPDFTRIVIDIRTSGVTWAEGTFPHPHGVVKIKWHLDGNNRIFDRIEVPEGCIVEVRD
jgi:hypothetical protein